MPMRTRRYNIQIHSHRLAAWAASRGASTRRRAFSVAAGTKILERAGFVPTMKHPPVSQVAFDQWHQTRRKEIVSLAKDAGLTRFTEGQAAKLINLYLKNRFVCRGGNEVRSFHPPIDRILLLSLMRSDVGGMRKKWRDHAKKGWSNLDGEGYTKLINDARIALSITEGKNAGLWMIEKYWDPAAIT